LGAILPDAFPPLDPDEVPPCAYGQSGCTREIFLKDLATRRQVYLPNTTPAYGNAAFATLGLILESKTGLSYADNLAKLLNLPLNLSSTTSTPPSANNPHVIFGTDPSAAWNITLDGAGTGMGALFSSTNDLSAIGRSILSSSLLQPNTTRAWLKPTSHTSSLTGSVGRAWEIYRVPLGPAENNRVVDMYTKAGNGFGYGSTIALIPDFDVGFVVLQAGNYGTVPLSILSIITDHLLPALEDAARLEAENVFAGTYAAANGLNSSLTITSTKGVPGLTITQWISNGTDIAGLVFGAPTLQMYPTNLMRDESTYSWRVGTARTQPPGPFSACPSWFALDRPPYGVYGVDEMEFKVGGSGRAEMAEPKAFKVVLERDG
jgi:CubicO group peptidase (beta-lactamase class C family)